MRIGPAAELALHAVDGGEPPGADRVLYVTTLPTGHPVVLNAMAAEILERALELGSREAVVATLAEDFDADPDLIGPDVDRVLEGLAAQGILRLEEDPADDGPPSPTPA